MSVRQGLAFLAMAVCCLLVAMALTPRYSERVGKLDGPLFQVSTPAQCGSDAECVAMFGPEIGVNVPLRRQEGVDRYSVLCQGLGCGSGWPVYRADGG